MKTKSNPNRGLQVLLLTLVLLAATFVLLLRTSYSASEPGQPMGLDQVYRLAEAGQISEAKLLDEDAVVTGAFCTEGPASAATRVGEPLLCPEGRTEEFHATYPRSDVATQQLIDRIGGELLNEDGTTAREAAPVVVDRQTGKAVGKLLITFVLPLVMLANLFGLIFLSRGGDSSLADIAGFGRLSRKRQRKNMATSPITFADVAGVDEAVVELKEVIDYLKDPAKFQAYGAVAPKGVLLYGPPGCGKTLLARAVAGEAGVPFISVSGTEFVESLVGVGAARVRDLFAQVRDVAPAIVFVDEIDAVGRRREGEGVSGGEREQTLNQLLVEMDGFETSAGLVVMAATNRPDILDPALLRPGRFDRHVTLEVPDRDGREAILRVHAAGRPVAADVDFTHLARRTPGFTGADLANVINEAALMAVREGSEGGTQITSTHVSEAVQRVLHGPHRGTLLTPEERRRIAIHEAGHAVVTSAVGQRENLHRVSIVARGKGLGTSQVSTEGEKAVLTRDEMEASLAMAMAGVAAEELVLGRSSTTAEDDIERATRVAKEMVGLYGMSTEIGRVRMLHRYGGYLMDATAMEGVSETTLTQFDAEVRKLIATAEARATEMLRENAAALEGLVNRLQEEETLEGAQLEQLLAGVKPAVVPGNNGAGHAHVGAQA